MRFVYNHATTTAEDKGRNIRLRGFSVSLEQHFGFILHWQDKVIPVLAIPDFIKNAAERADHWILYSLGAPIGRYDAYHFTKKKEFEEAAEIALEALTAFPYSSQQDRPIFAALAEHLTNAIGDFTS